MTLTQTNKTHTTVNGTQTWNTQITVAFLSFNGKHNRLRTYTRSLLRFTSEIFFFFSFVSQPCPFVKLKSKSFWNAETLEDERARTGTRKQTLNVHAVSRKFSIKLTVVPFQSIQSLLALVHTEVASFKNCASSSFLVLKRIQFRVWC